jgi:hypothetical protein
METRLTLYSGSVPDPDSLKNLLSPVRKRSIMLAGHKTSVSLEDQFWDGLHEIAARDGVTTSALVERIDTNRTVHNLACAGFNGAAGPPSHPPIPAVRICRYAQEGCQVALAAFLFKSFGLLKPQPIPGG